MTRRSFLQKSRGGPPASRDLLLVTLTLVVVDAIAAFFLLYVYFPARRRETLEKTPAQLSLLARDRQNALAGWVRERLSDAELIASHVPASKSENEAAELLDRFLRAYRYESAFLVNDSGVVVRGGSTETDDASVVRFAREAMHSSATKIDFRRVASRKPKIFTAAKVAPSPESATVVFVSDPYDYVYPLFSTFAVASRTGETNLIGIYGEEGVALNPYPEGFPPPMTLKRRIPRDFAAHALASGERSIRYVDRREQPVIGVAKVIPHTEWVVIAKIDEEEALAGAVAETKRLGGLLAFVSLMLASIAFAILRSRRVHELRAAENQLARLFENSTTGIIVLQVIFDGAGSPVDHEIVEMNPAAEHLLGVTASEEIGKRCADAVYLQWPAETRARNYEVALTGTAIQYERFSSALERWYETRSFSPRYGQFAQLFTDITERKKSEAAVRKLSARLLRVQDETRRRIARELHETVAQSLAGIRLNLSLLKRTISGNGREPELVNDSISMTDEAITQTRTLSYLLHPPMIDQAGLLTTLRWYVDGFQQRSGIVTTLDAPDELGELSRDIETSVFRIVQESLTNIKRHAGSTSARVSIERLDHHLSIEIADQGRGLPLAVRDDLDALLASGVGIAGVNERVHELGGEMAIRSSDQGTTLTVTLPVDIKSVA